MAYLACHSLKFKATDVRGIQIHNQRESDNSKNKDIDPARTSLNYDLHNDENINYVQKVKEHIKSHLGDSKHRKDAVVMMGVLVTSNKDFFDNLDPQQQRQFFKTAYDFIAEKYGKENIVAARVHVDEKTPHMHLNLVPITPDGRLCAKKLFDRQNLLYIQKELPRRLQKAGFDIERGESAEETRSKRVDPNEFKRQELEKEKQYLEEQKAVLKAVKEVLSEDIKSYNRDRLDLEKRKAELANDEFVVRTEKAQFLDQAMVKYPKLKDEFEQTKRIKIIMSVNDEEALQYKKQGLNRDSNFRRSYKYFAKQEIKKNGGKWFEKESDLAVIKQMSRYDERNIKIAVTELSPSITRPEKVQGYIKELGIGKEIGRG